MKKNLNIDLSQFSHNLVESATPHRDLNQSGDTAAEPSEKAATVNRIKRLIPLARGWDALFLRTLEQRQKPLNSRERRILAQIAAKYSHL